MILSCLFLQLEQTDLESSYYNIPGAVRCSDVVFKSPELIERRVHHYPVFEAEIDKMRDRNNDDSDTDDNFRRKLSSGSERQNGHANDCCDCNIELRDDIERLKSQVNRLDQTMTSNMTKIVALLERNFNSQSDGRKFGVSPMSYSSQDGSANTSV